MDSSKNSAIGFGNKSNTFDMDETNSPSHSHHSTHSHQSDESFLMSNKNHYNGSFSNKDRRPSKELTMFENNSSEFTTFNNQNEENRVSMAFGSNNVLLPDTSPSTQMQNRSTQSDNFDNNNNNNNKETALSLNDHEKDEEKKIGKAGPRRRKSKLERTSFLKQDFIALKEEEQWNKVKQRLNKVFDEEIGIKLKEYAIEEEFDFQAILDDIEDYQENPDDSNIIEFMQSFFSWNDGECDKFFRTLKRILMDRKTSRRSSSMAQILGMSNNNSNNNQIFDNNEEYQRIIIHEPRPNIRKNNDEQKMYLSEFNEKWTGDIVEKLQKYCVEEEYDMEAIAEDLETFEEENSMIVEEIAKEYGWDANKSKNFVDDLRRLISTDPVTAKRQFSVVSDDEDDDDDDY